MLKTFLRMTLICVLSLALVITVPGATGRRRTQLETDTTIYRGSAFAITPKGLLIYDDFPPVIAFFNKTFVRSNAIKEVLKTGRPTRT
jgi:hypothetical protein